MTHQEVWQLEKAMMAPGPFENWANAVERILGHDLDGDQERDGYSLDFAHDAFMDGMSARDFAATVRTRRNGSWRVWHRSYLPAISTP